MSIFEDEEKREIISVGPSLFIESIRERSEPAGKNIPLTSWFYLLQNTVKIAMQSGQLQLNMIKELGNIYDINLYKQDEFQNQFIRRIKYVAKQTELDFVVKDNKILSNISKKDVRSSFKNFLDIEYNYAITSNLVKKNFDAHTEIIVWHLLNDINNFPRPLGYERKLAYDIVNEYASGIETKDYWDIEKLQNVPILIDGWMRALVETKKFEVINDLEIGQIYSPPRFSDIDKRILFSGPYAEICRAILDNSNRAPSWPIRTNIEYNNACCHLTSAGLIEYISEKDKELRDYGYVVPRDLFWDVDIKLNYLYKDNSDVKDTTLTEQLFRTIGRARLAVNVLKVITLDDMTDQLTKLETGVIKSNDFVKKILNPLMVKGTLSYNKDDNTFTVIPGMEKDIEILLDIWNKMDMIDLNIPKEEYAKEKRAAQTRSNFKKKAYQWFLTK